MDSSISSRSLITGNVSTEESKKEIRKSPGAPSPAANVTTFCFHPLKFYGKDTFSSPSLKNCRGVAIVFGEAEESRSELLREGRAIEMIHKDLHQRRTMEIRQLGDFPDHADMAKAFDSFAVLPVLIADQHNTVHRQFRCVKCGQRQQRVIHRPQRAPRG